MDQEVFRKVYPGEYLKRFLVKDVRPDGRSPTTARRLTVTTGSIRSAVGSAMLKMGRTTVVAGVHATLVPPSVSLPEQGILDIVVELLSLGSSTSKGGRISDDAACLTEYVRSLIAPHVDLQKLCIEAGTLVWRLRLTIYCMDNDGNLDDSVLLAAVAAMRDVLLPTVQMIDEEAEPNGDGSQDKMAVDKSPELSHSIMAIATAERTISLEIETFPLPVSFVLFDDKALIDPSAEEESLCDSRMTFLFRSSGELRGVLKPGGKNLPSSGYQACLSQAKERIPILLAKLTKS